MQTATNNTDLNPADDGKTIDGEITVVTEQFQALVNIDAPEFVAQVFAPFRKELTTLKRRAAKDANYDITTPAGMATAKDLKKQFAKIRTTAENIRKERKAPIVEIGKLLDTEYKKLETDVREHEDRHALAIEQEAQRLAEIERQKIEAERVRVEQIESRLASIRGLPMKYAQADSETLAITVQELVEKRLDPAMYEEYLEDAVRALNTSIEELNQLHAAALGREAAARQAEADRQELARLKAEQAERERIAAEEKAERDRQARLDREAAEAQAKELAAQQVAVQRQQQQMQEIMEIKAMADALQATGERTRESLQAAINKVRAFEPGTYGTMAAMAAMVRDAALPILEDLLADMPTPTAWEAPPAPALVTPDVVTFSPPCQHFAPEFRAPAEPAVQLDDSQALAELRGAVIDLHATRDSAAILELVSDLLDELDAGEGK
jgi:hypothetical protein